MNLVELFCFVDDFCQSIPDHPANEHTLMAPSVRKRDRKSRLAPSEIMTLLLWFQQSHYRNFKQFYCCEVLQGSLLSAFPKALSYTRFVATIPNVLHLLCALLQRQLVPFQDDIGFIDSTPIVVCHSKRIYQHKVFKNLAKSGKSSKGWFYGFKLHLICNTQGELCACKFTSGNVSDQTPVLDMTTSMSGKLFGDKGYISSDLANKLQTQGLQLITGLRSNMKNKLMTLFDKLMLKKRSLIESVNNQLKNLFHLEHSRHRSVLNAFVHMLGAVIAFTFHPNKPAIKM